MTEKCYVCKTGHMSKSGSHLYCDKCNFSRFIVTNEYIDSCVVVLADLVSNTKYATKQDLARSVFVHIASHLPMLDQYLSTVVNGQEALGGVLFPAIEAQAVNLQIGTDILNPEEAVKSLRCQCGSESFNMHSPSKVVCAKCTATYRYQESSGKFMPEFLCQCGCAAYTEEDKFIVTCSGCDKPYMKTINGFQAVGS